VSNYNRDLSGTAYLQDIQPGGEVYVPIRDEFVPLERVRVDFTSETMDVEFDYTKNDANAAATLNAAEETETRQSIGLDDKKSVKDAFGLDDSAFTDEDEGGEEAKQPKEEAAKGDFGVTINSTNSPVEEYDTVEVNATVTNNDGNNAQDGRFVFSVGGTRQEVKNRTIGAGESQDLSFKWQTGDGDKGNYTATVESGTDSASTNVTVEGFPDASGDFNVSIVGTNSPRQEGETVLVTADITNNKSSSQTGTFVLSIDGTPTSYREDVSFDADETQSLTFAWATGDGDAGDHTAEVASGTASDSTTVTVEKSDGAPDPGAFSVWIESAPSQVTYPDDDVTVTAGVHYDGSVSSRVILRLEEDAPGSVGATADLSEITISPGETRTVSLTWDRVDLVPDYFVPGDVQLCVEADRDGVPGVQDSDCTTITVTDGKVCEIPSTSTVSDLSASGVGYNRVNVETLPTDCDAINCGITTQSIDDPDGETSLQIYYSGDLIAEEYIEYDSNGNVIDSNDRMPNGDDVVVSTDAITSSADNQPAIRGDPGLVEITAKSGELTIESLS